MAVPVNRMAAIEGGFVVVEGGRVLAELPLPVAGLMSLEPFETVRERLVTLRAAAKSPCWGGRRAKARLDSAQGALP